MSAQGFGTTIAKKLKVALCQIKVTSDKITNINTARNAITSSVKNYNAELVVLPEIWNSPYSTSSFPKYAEAIPAIGYTADSEELYQSTTMLCNMAKKYNIWLVGGSIPERSNISENEKIYNTCIIVNPEGVIVGKHRKVHLFDIDVPGKITFKESDSLTAGDTITTFDTPWGKIGVGICYDIRFPELALIMRQKGCIMLIYPGAFNMTTGPAHWELLQRARAVDNQLYVAACSPARDESGGYVAWGHSSIVSPWGEVVASADAGEEIVFSEIDFTNVDNMRQNIPTSNQKRYDLYNLVDLKP